MAAPHTGDTTAKREKKKKEKKAKWVPYSSTAEQQEEWESRPVNMWTGQKQAGHHEDTRQKRMLLPVVTRRAEFLEKFHAHDILLFVGTTGSGKSTQLIQFIAEDICGDAGYPENYLQKRNQQVVMTQPRRLAATSVSERVAEEMGVSLGAGVGYKIRHDDKTTRETFASVVTDGTLLMKAKSRLDLPWYEVIILDEAHERTGNTDILMAAVKMASHLRRQAQKPLKVVIMSATLDTELFRGYFPDSDGAHENVMEVSASNHHVEVQYLESQLSGDLAAAAAQTVVEKIHMQDQAGDILVFLPGSYEIEKVSDAIAKYVERKKGTMGTLEVVKLTAKSAKDDSGALSRPPPVDTAAGPGRKVYLATNVAETSLTFTGLTYVVDSGLAKQKVFNPRTNTYMLQNVPASKKQTQQRWGRVGRTHNGKVFCLYTQRQYDRNFPDNSTPEMLTTEMVEHFSTILSLDQSPVDFPLLQPPATDTFLHAVNEMAYMNMFRGSLQDLTDHGKHLAKLALHPMHAHILVLSVNEGCNSEMACILAFASVLEGGGEYLWKSAYTPKDKEILAASIERWAHAKGYFYTLLFVYHGWRACRNNAQQQDFCNRWFFKKATLQKVDSTRKQLIRELKVRKQPIRSLSYDDKNYLTKIGRALCRGYFLRSARRFSKDFFHTHPYGKAGSADVGQDVKWIIYHERIFVSHNKGHELTMATEVELEWLLLANWEYFDPQFLNVNSAVRKEVLSAFRDPMAVSTASATGLPSLFPAEE